MLHILLIGDVTRPEFREAGSALEEVARVTRFADVDTAIAALDALAPPVGNAGHPLAGRGVPMERDSRPSWNATEGVPYSRDTHCSDGASAFRPPHGEVHGIALAQAYPGQFSAAAIDRLRHRMPLVRVFAILGSWCEGEPRSGRPLPGVVRMYWHQAGERIRREFGLKSRLSLRESSATFAERKATLAVRDPLPGEIQSSTWQLPATATEEERLLASVREPLPSGQGLVAIWTRRPEMEGLLAEACRRAGYATAWLHPRHPARVQGAVAAVYDGDALDAAGRAELTRLATEVSPAPVVALLDAPRNQDVRLARKLGAAVLAKPFRIDELLWLLS